MKTPTFMVVFATAAVLWGCSSCGSGGNGADTDTGTGSDTGIDTDWDGGPLTPCEGEAPEGMVCVPGGTYLMGCMPYDTQCDPSELPMVQVTLSPFFIDENETTYEEVIPFLNTLYDGYYRGPTYVTKGGVLDGGIDGQVIYRPSYDAVPPVGLNDAGLYEWGVSHGENTCWKRSVDAASGCFGWLGAKEYCEWQGKRLPTEAEWEAAARGQTKWIYPCAWEHLSCWYGKYDNCDSDGECAIYGEMFENCCLPVAENQTVDCASQCGAKRMYGNAYEWVLDKRDDGDDHSWCADGCTDPTPTTGEHHIVKGGSIWSSAFYTRISARTAGSNPQGGPHTGVRCVLSPITFDDPPDGAE
jgi:formylglycine-generating enzyme required for sulfatase activity